MAVLVHMRLVASVWVWPKRGSSANEICNCFQNPEMQFFTIQSKHNLWYSVVFTIGSFVECEVNIINDTFALAL